MQEEADLRENIAWAKSTRVGSAGVLIVFVCLTAFMWWKAQDSLATRVDVNDAVAMYEYMTGTVFALFAGFVSILTLLFILATATYKWLNERKLAILLGEQNERSLQTKHQ